MRYDNRSAHKCVTERQYTCGPNKKNAPHAERYDGVDRILMGSERYRTEYCKCR